MPGVGVVEVPAYAGIAADSSGRIRDQAPSAPTSSLVMKVLPSANVTS